MIVAGSVAGVALLANLRDPPERSPRAGRAPAAEAAVAPRAAGQKKTPGKPTGKAARKAKKKAVKKKPGKKPAVRATAVPSPELTPQQKKELQRRWKASAALIAKSRSPKEREQLERHLRRFLGRGGATGRDGAWVDPQIEALRAQAVVKAQPLADPEPDESEKRRLEQLEKLRQRRAVGLLDHIHGGLAWLALHQAPDGHFSDAASVARCKALGHGPPCLGGKRSGRYAVASTAFAIMALLDFRDQDVIGLFEPSLASAVHWLRKKQRKNGSFPGQGQLYSSAIALMALAQAAESTGDEKLREAVRKGLVLFAARPGPLGGYRYRFGTPGDLSATGWVAQAVEMARRAGVEIPPLLAPNLGEFLDSVWLGEHRFAYLSRQQDRSSLYPVGMLTARILWPEPDRDVVASWRKWLGKQTNSPRLYSLYYGVRVAIAMEKGLPQPWRKWVFAYAKYQARQGPAAGAFLRGRSSWLLKADRTLHTAVAVLTLEHALYLR
jgi:hypothetical protein